MNDFGRISPTILIVPGLRDHMPDHWQTILAQQLTGAVTVPRMERDKLSCAAWVALRDQSYVGPLGP